MESSHSFLRMHWDYERRSAAFRPQTPLPVERARHLPKGVGVPALLRPEGRAPKFQFTERRSVHGARHGGLRFPMPPELVKKYDKDGDGRLNEEEEQAAREGMRRQWEELQKKYDKNGNGFLDEEELAALRKDAEAGKLAGVPRFFGR